MIAIPLASIFTLQAQAAVACVAMAASTLQAVASAAARTPTTFNLQFNAPFARDFSQDIDPVTTWMLPFAFGMVPGSPRATALVTEVRSLQALAARGLETADTASVDSTTVTRDATAQPALQLSTGDMAAMRRSVENLNTLIGPARR